MTAATAARPAPARHRSSPGRHASAELAPEPAAARRARQLTRDALTRWGLPGLRDDAETIASELAANAQHAATTPPGTRPAIIFAIHRQPGQVTITVWDNGPGHPRPAEPGTDDQTGRGLAIVAALSRQWGWWPTPISGGKVTWADLPAPDNGPQDTR